MKCLGVYGEENPSEPTFLLRLVNNHDGSYTLAAVDKNGEIIDGGYLGRIDKHGFRELGKECGGYA